MKFISNVINVYLTFNSIAREEILGVFMELVYDVYGVDGQSASRLG